MCYSRNISLVFTWSLSHTRDRVPKSKYGLLSKCTIRTEIYDRANTNAIKMKRTKAATRRTSSRADSCSNCFRRVHIQHVWFLKFAPLYKICYLRLFNNIIKTLDNTKEESQVNGQHRVHKKKSNKTKHNPICVGHL